jgi:hypothetical protein
MHEQEVRVATFCDGRSKGRIIRGIQSDCLIKEIILSPLWPYKESEAVTRVLKQRPWKSPPIIRTSELLGSNLTQKIKEAYELIGESTERGGFTESDLPLLIREL